MRVATYNVWAKNPAREVADDLHDLLPKADVVGFQEFSSDKDREQLAAYKSFKVFRGVEDPSVPIAWRRSAFELIEAGSEYLSSDTDVGPEGAGPSVLKGKQAVWVRLRHRETGRYFVFINCHLAPSIYLEERRQLHIQQTDRLRNAMVRLKRKGNIICVGDFNIDYHEDRRSGLTTMPYRKFLNINIRSTWDILNAPNKGTHGDRLIDYIWVVDRPRKFKPRKHVILDGFGSDHKPVVATIDVTRRLFHRR